MSSSKAVNILANLAARYKLVPFLGAGCSKSILKTDWNGIRNEMANELGFQSEDHPIVAQKYVERNGKDGLCDFLKQRLVIDEFDAMNGTTVLKILSLGLGVIYTTNQDNVLEKCFEHYGRKYNVITVLEDLAESLPMEYLYFKYHGDLSRPESVVFTTEDYNQRISEQDHFLNIRLRADLLAKNLLFIGYSFQDKNILELLSGLKSAFYGRLPQAYLIAYHNNDELEKTCTQYGVTVIDPRREYPKCTSDQEAFDTLMSEFATKTIRKKQENEVANLFAPKIPRSQRVLIASELDAIEQAIQKDSIEQAIRVFRSNIDGTEISGQFEERVLVAFLNLCEKCSTDEDAPNLYGAAFNINFRQLENRLMAQAGIMALTNLFPTQSIMPFVPNTRNFPRLLNVLAGAKAIELLFKWGRTINDSFRNNLTSWMDLASASVDAFPPAIHQWITERVNRAWNTGTPLENPIQRQKRLKNTGRITGEVPEDLLAQFPDNFFA